MNAHKMLVFRTQNISKKKSQPNQIHAVVLCFLRPVVVSPYAVIESKHMGKMKLQNLIIKCIFNGCIKVFHQFLYSFYHTFLPCCWHKFEYKISFKNGQEEQIKKKILKNQMRIRHMWKYMPEIRWWVPHFKVFPRIMFVISLIILCNGILISSSVRDVVQNGLRVVTLRWFKFE